MHRHRSSRPMASSALLAVLSPRAKTRVLNPATAIASASLRLGRLGVGKKGCQSLGVGLVSLRNDRMDATLSCTPSEPSQTRATRDHLCGEQGRLCILSHCLLRPLRGIFGSTTSCRNKWIHQVRNTSPSRFTTFVPIKSMVPKCSRPLMRVGWHCHSSQNPTT